jgi:hypothetical protein
MTYQIEVADNGWIVEWWEENNEGENVQHQIVFQLPDDEDINADPDKLIEFLYFVKERICGYVYSKHKTRNVMIRMEANENLG